MTDRRKPTPNRGTRKSGEKGGRPRVALFRSVGDAERWISRDLGAWYERTRGRAFTAIDAARLGPTDEAQQIADVDKRCHEILVKLLQLAKEGREAIVSLAPALARGPSTNMLEKVIERIELPAPPRKSRKHARAMYPLAFDPLDALVRELDLEATSRDAVPPSPADVAKIALLAGHRPGSWPACVKHKKPGEVVNMMAGEVRECRARVAAELAWMSDESARK